MSSILILLFLLPFDLSLSQQNTNQADYAKLVKQLVIIIWSQHNIDIVDSIFSNDCIYEDVAAKKLLEGKNELKDFLKENFTAIPDFKAKLTHVISSGNLVACEWIMTGTQTGDFPELPAKGKAFSVRGASICLIENNKIKKWTDYYDMFDFLQQLGVVKNSQDKH